MTALKNDLSVHPVANAATIRTLRKGWFQAFGLSILSILLWGKIYHFWTIIEYALPEITAFEYGTIDQHITLSSPRFHLSPRPPLPQNESFGACLMIKGDNDLLTEWVSYHYTVLPLRYVLVISDADNPETPTTVLKRWSIANTDLQWWVVNSSLVQDVHGKFDEDSARQSYQRKRRNRGRSPTNGTDDPDLIQYIAHSRLIGKQNAMITQCTAFMKMRGVRWVTLYDTDEFLAINRMGMHEANESKNATTMERTESSGIGEDEPLNETYGMRPNLPERQSNATVVDIIKSFQSMGRPLKPCHTMPRVLFGAEENFTCPGSENVEEFARANFDYGILSTLRFQQHAVKGDFLNNRFGKVFLDLSNISDNTLSRPPSNIHRPFRDECIRPVMEFKKAPFYLMHYSGGWERFKAKNDTRRGFDQWKKLADVNDSTSCCQEENYQWLPRFVDQVGLERAKYLLGHTKRRNHHNFSSGISG